MKRRSQARNESLPTINEILYDRYAEQTNVLEDSPDKPRISLDRYHEQMAAVAVEAARDRLA